MKRIKLFFKNYNYLHIAIIAVILFIGIFVRLDNLGRQMTSADDIGVAWTLTAAKSGYNIEFIKNKVFNKEHPDYSTPQYKFLRNLNDNGILEEILPILNGMVKFVIIPQAWTYAPLQFFFTPLFLGLAHDYHSVIFWGRMPSVIFSVMALVSMILLYFRLNHKIFLIPGLTGLLLLSLSWENIIYAKHMSGYAIGVLAAILLLHILVSILKNNQLTIKNGILIGLMLVILTNMQYQILYFIPALFLVWFFKYFSYDKFNFSSVVTFIKTYNFRVILASFLSYTFFILPTFIFLIVPQFGANKSDVSGISSIFYFHIPINANIFELLLYFLQFFIMNSFKIIEFVTTFLPYNSYLFSSYSASISALFIIGVISCSFCKNIILNKMALFLLFSFLTIIVLVIFGDVAFAPTRHYLIWLPFLALFVSEGVDYVYTYIQNKTKFKISLLFVISLIFFIFLPFIINYKSVVENRNEQFDERKIVEIIKVYRPQYVIVPAFSLWSNEILNDYDKVEFSSSLNKNYVDLFEIKENFASNVYLIVNQSDYPFNLCNQVDLDLKRLGPVCDKASHDVLYEISSSKDTSLDISNETKAIYNNFLVKVVRIK